MRCGPGIRWSLAGLQDGYVASKHGALGLMRTWATWLAPYAIRVNCVNPSGVANLLDVTLIDAADVTAAVTWLVSDEARFVTGVALPIDAGFLAR